ncbi:MAG: IPT/TIG domain-containing protein [Bacteroidales bacterium]|nr:IPT/TIG domain-containing protein [Bacteroidales bacterium]
MKTYFRILATSAIAALAFAGCDKDNEPFATASADDAPRILNTDIPEWVNGEPAQLTSIERTANFTFEIIATPVDYTTVTWNIDGENVLESKEIDMALLAGIHPVVVTATTVKGLSTTRSFTVAVRPSDGDPILDDLIANRLGTPGKAATVTGVNLQNVTKMYLGSTAVTIDQCTASQIDYTIPASLAAGAYPVYLEDASGTRYGGVYAINGNEGTTYGNYTVSASSDPFVTTTSVRCKPGADVTLNGINLENVGSLTLGGESATIVSKSYDELVFTCPSLEAGDYTLSGKSTDNKAVSFSGNETCAVTLTSAVTLWEGSFDVTWGTPFDALKETMSSLVTAGTTVKAVVDKTGADAGQGTMTTAWWNNILTGEGDPNRGDITIDKPMELEFTLTAYSIELMNAQNGVLFVGNGYTITRITAE